MKTYTNSYKKAKTPYRNRKSKIRNADNNGFDFLLDMIKKEAEKADKQMIKEMDLQLKKDLDLLSREIDKQAKIEAQKNLLKEADTLFKNLDKLQQNKQGDNMTAGTFRFDHNKNAWRFRANDRTRANIIRRSDGLLELRMGRVDTPEKGEEGK